MINANFTYFDAAVLGVMALSCLFAFFRGFVREILSLGAWIGAGLITLYYFPSLAVKMQPHFKNPMVAAGIATLGLYVTSLLGFSIINAFILRYVKEGGDVGFLDNMLGLFFGALRGAFIVSLAFFLMTMGMNEKEYPEWLKGARTRPAVEKGALVLAQIAPEYLRDLSSLNDRITGRKHVSSSHRHAEKQENEESGESDAGASQSDVLEKMLGNVPQSRALAP
ncbi:MAG: CvpA family protein [Alphaproteobacteria bacterium]|nr:CvpA family protein [Alphaproteobacteria bacterium]